MKVGKLSLILLVVLFGILTIPAGFLVYRNRSHDNSKSLTQLPINYAQCKQSGSAIVNDLVCDLILSGNSPIFNDCASNGGGVSHQDFTGVESCSITYYNFLFNKWPQNYKDCARVFGDPGGTGVCGEIIPREDMFKAEATEVLAIRDQCLVVGGKIIEEGPLGKKLDPKQCVIGFRK